MKIRVAIFDQDQEYQSRLAETLQKNYPEKLEVFTCSSVESIPDTVSQNDVQLLAVSQGTELDVTQLQDKCAVVSLVETKVNKEITADNIFDVPEVGRYQSINDIARALYVYGNSYKDIFEVKKEADNVAKQKEVIAERIQKFEEEQREAERLEAERKAAEEAARLEAERLEAERKAAEEKAAAEKARLEAERAKAEAEKRAAEEKLRQRRSNPDIYAFMSALPGDGAFTISTFAAMLNTSDDYRILYIDLSKNSKMERWFATGVSDTKYADLLRKAAEGEADGDMVKAAVSKDVNTNLDCIYNTNNAAYEVMALGAEGVRNLIKAIGETAEYDCVVFNLECDYTIANFTVMELSTKTYLLGTGQKESNAAMTRLTEVISKYDDATKLAVAKARTAALNTEEGEKVEIPNRASIVGKAEVFYNKFVNRTSVTEKLMGYDIYGVLNLVKERTDQKFIASMSKQELIANCIVKNV